MLLVQARASQRIYNEITGFVLFQGAEQFNLNFNKLQ